MPAFFAPPQEIAIGAVAWMVIGFSRGGWVTGATANKLAADRADTAVAAAPTPICVESSCRTAMRKRNLADLRKISLVTADGPSIGN
jgi:hypothetical protein